MVSTAGHVRAGAGRVTAVALAAVVSASACAGQPRPRAESPPRREPHTHPAPGSSRGGAAAPAVGIPGGFRVAKLQMVFVEPAHTGAAGAYSGQRRLPTQIRYPQARGASGSRPDRGGFPLILFAPGFMQCGGPYAPLLDAWASAGYVVAAVNFPKTDCHAGARTYEPDLVNQPADMSYVLSRLLARSARPHDPFSGPAERARDRRRRAVRRWRHGRCPRGQHVL